MNELISVEIKDNGEYAVSAKELYRFLSDKPKHYKEWVKRNIVDSDFSAEGTDYEVLPTTGTTDKGGQTAQDYSLSIDFAKELCMMSRCERGKQARQYFISIEKDWNSPEKVIARALIMSQKKVQELTPLANVGMAIAQTPDVIPMGDLAKILKQNGVDIGRTRLFEWLRSNGYIQWGSRVPTQKSMNLGLFRIVEQPVNDNVYRTTYVTGKGQHYFINKFTEVVE